ncbi:MAG: hypothetical protein ABFR36_08850 [Acidobacteriota bacterium]
MTKSKFLSKSLKILKIPVDSGIEEITKAYLGLTNSVKFKKIFILNEETKEEFIKYHEAYVLAVREISNTAPDSAPGYYPSGHIFDLLYNQGIYQLLKENYLKAGEKLEEAARMKKDNVNLQIYLGYILHKRKNYYAAENYFLKANQMDKENEYAVFLLGKTYLSAGKLDKASATFRKVETMSFYNNEIKAETRDAFREIERIRLKNSKKSIISRVFKK